MIKLANVKLAEVIPPSIAVDAKMRAIADAVDVELNKQPDLIKSIALWAQLNALPSGVLDHLAWQFNVPVWRDSWPQATKVSVLRTAIRDKSVVGTRGAVERAVQSLGSAVQIVEWFEATVPADPYTFEIIIDLNSIPGQADVETQEDLRRAVDAAKPARSHYRVILSLKLTGLFGMYATGRPAVVSVLRGVSVESFDPLSLSPLVWLDPNDLSTLFIDAAGTTPVTASGDPVGLWKNKGTLGSAGDAVQTVSASRPLYAGDSINGLTETVYLQTGLTVAAPCTVVVAYDLAGTAASQGIIGTITSNLLGYWRITRQTSEMRFNVPPPSTRYASTAVIGNHSITAASIALDGTVSVMTDKSPAGTVTVGSGWSAVAPTRIGGFAGGTFAGKVRDVFVFDRVLTAGERVLLIAYLEAKHGI